MNDFKPILQKIYREESGQMLPWIVMLMVLFIGMAGLTLDLGHAYICYRELQASTDAAALAGAYAMTLPTATVANVTTAVQNASSQGPGGANMNINLPQAAVTPHFACVPYVTTTFGVPCTAGVMGDNAIQVTQTAVIPTMFIRILSLWGINSASSINLTTVATAALKGAAPAQYNVAMVVDSTNSMGQNDTDVNCGDTRIHCALQGVQTMLGLLAPCAIGSPAGGCTPYDQVSLFTFPPVEANTASDDTSCPSSTPTITPYTTPAKGATWAAPTGTAGTYQITTYLSNYSSTNQTGGSLNTSSGLTIATGGGVGTKKNPCNGIQTPGGDGTYYAGAIYAAASSLVAAQAANPGSVNALIILSDGDANSTKIAGSTNNGATYGSAQDQCAQAIAAAQYAAGLPNTTVYTIAYGSPNSGCSTDVKSKSNAAGTGVTPCQAMEQMSSGWSSGDYSHFFSDASASANPGQCISTDYPGLALDDIFTALTYQFGKSRLIPNSVWPAS
ncbi:MAG: pilus assembly protein TadG-related protein [Terracidiphilus sp.]